MSSARRVPAHERAVAALPRYRLVAALGRLLLAALAGVAAGTVAAVLREPLGSVGAWLVAAPFFVGLMTELVLHEVDEHDEHEPGERGRA
jgi:hypothetical protein